MGAVVAVGAVGALANAEREATSDIVTESAVAQKAVADRAIGLIEKKVNDRTPIARRRVRALYRATRDGQKRTLFRQFDTRDPRTAVELRRLVRRDLSELGTLTDELDRVRRSSSALAATAPTPATKPALRAPVANARVVTGFGMRRDGRLRQTSRGIDLAATRGAPVVAPMAGNVVYRGPVRGIGTTVVLAGEGHWVVLGPIDGQGPAVGAQVTRGETLGALGGDALHLELRRQSDRGGVPVDPRPLTP